MNRGVFIKNVIKGSIAEEAGIEKGDMLISINGNDIEDLIEYRFLTCEEYLNILIKKENGEEWEIEVEKDFYEDLGMEFDDLSCNNPKSCHNKCMFCFIDQLPKGMRESLYFKDDDTRLSFIHGNFVTLTNMKDEDIDRIIKYRISPINVSVHTTNPRLRVEMLNNKKAGRIMELLKKLAEGGISINCQIVLCPGINDGDELIRTLNELFTLYPFIKGASIVPVGITKFREGLYPLKGYDKESSKKLIELLNDIQNNFIEKSKEPFARLGDEFYVMAGIEPPQTEHYGDFEQLEDGIGMIRYMEECVKENIKNIKPIKSNKSIAMITGVSAAGVLNNTAKKIQESLGIKINVYTVKNEFFGERITVSGLLTARDIINQTASVINEDFVFIPSCMLKADEDIFLDDMTFSDFKSNMGKEVIKCKYTGEDLIERIVNEVILCQNQ